MDTMARMATGFLLLVNTILVIFVCNMMLEIRKDLAQMPDVATKQDLTALTAPQITFGFQGACTRCHSERRFSHLANAPGDEVHKVVQRMKNHPMVDINDRDITQIQASLSLLKCTLCHSKDILRGLVLKTDEERLEIIHRMQEKHNGVPITRDEARKILESYKIVLGLGKP